MTTDKQSRDDKHIITLIKGVEKYIFIYDNAGRDDTIRTLARFAMNSDLSFSWFDAVALRKRMDQGFSCEGK